MHSKYNFLDNKLAIKCNMYGKRQKGRNHCNVVVQRLIYWLKYKGAVKEEMCKTITSKACSLSPV